MISSKIESSSTMKSFLNKLRNLDDSCVETGYYPEQTHPNSDLNLAEMAAINELGSEEQNIPARDFMWQSFCVYFRGNGQKNADDLVAHYLYNKGSNLKSELSYIGKQMQWFIPYTIDTGGDFEDNAKYTVTLKGRNQPLVDQGYMRDNSKIKIYT